MIADRRRLLCSIVTTLSTATVRRRLNCLPYKGVILFTILTASLIVSACYMYIYRNTTVVQTTTNTDLIDKNSFRISGTIMIIHTVSSTHTNKIHMVMHNFAHDTLTLFLTH